MKHNKEVLQKKRKKASGFDVINRHVAGIDIGAKEIYVALPDQTGNIIVLSFGTTTPQLRSIVQALKKYNIVSVAMEATGVYWVPLMEIVQDSNIEALLVDAKSIKNVPGRKTDVLDCQWIQRLHACGLLRSAYRPPKDKEPVRAYVRHRDVLVRERSKTILRMQKALLLMNIKLDVAVSDTNSVTGMRIIRAIIAGERDPKKLAELRHYRCKQTPKTFEEALEGNFQEHHLFALKHSMELFDIYAAKIDECDNKLHEELEKWETVTDELAPLREKDKSRQPKYDLAKKPDTNDFNFNMRDLLFRKTGFDITAVTGISEQTAIVIVSELGNLDMSAFNTEKRWCSWLALCPGNNVTGGKSYGGHSRKCKNRIKQALLLAANSLHKAKTALGAYLRRLKSRLSPSKAIKAVAHKLARIIYQAYTKGMPFVERGQEMYEKQYQERRLKNLERNAKELGFNLVARA